MAKHTHPSRRKRFPMRVGCAFTLVDTVASYRSPDATMPLHRFFRDASAHGPLPGTSKVPAEARLIHSESAK